MIRITQLNMAKTNFSVKHAVIILLCGLISTQASALKSDRDQPADIEADDIEFDFQKDTRTYVDNVIAIQGTLRLKADKLHAIYKEGELDTATAWGKLARFKQRPDGKPDDVEGWAKKIIVDQKANTLTLIGQASLRQGGQTANGNTIVYNMANDTLKVRGGGQLGTNGAKPTSDQPTPKRKLVDPFADDPIPQTAPTAKPKAAKNTEGSDQQDIPVAAPKPVAAPAPTRSGRSRLIIQPKSEPQESDSEESDSEESDSEESDSEESDSEKENN